MELRELIAERRKEKGWSQAQLAQHAGNGVKQQDVARIESGETKHSKHFVPIRKALGIDAEELGRWADRVVNEKIQARKSPIRRIQSAPVRGATAAGVWLEFENVHEFENHQAPYVPDRYPDLDQFAYMVRGRSMIDKDIYDGDFVICVDYSVVRAIPAPGDIVVAERRRGGLTERTCKYIERSPTDPPPLVLVSKSPDPEFNEPIPLGDENTEIELIGLVVGKFRPFL